VVLAALGPIVSEFTAQTGSRYSLSAAVVDQGTIRIDQHRGSLAADDWIERDGHLYSDKAPLQPLLGVPLYATARLVGAEPGTEVRVWGNLGAWWVTLWTSVVPLAALCAAMFLHVRRWQSRTAAPAALAMTFGTILVVLGTNMYGHVLAALLGYLAWLVARHPDPGRHRLLAAGALVGAAVTSEYTLALLGALIVADLVRRGHVRRLGWFVLGGAPFVILLACYQHLAYGNPWRTAYAMKDTLDGSRIVGGPDPGTGLAALVGSRGLLVLTPVVLLALVGAVIVLRDRLPGRADAAVGLLLLGVLVLVQSGWPNPWGGEVPGPRYLTPALPFLVGGLAVAWTRWRLLCVAATSLGATIMGLGVLSSHLVGHGGQVLPTYLENLDAVGLVDTTFTLAIGPFGWLVHAALALLAVHHLRQARREDPLDLAPQVRRPVADAAA
jgi:hypothetical protein